MVQHMLQEKTAYIIVKKISNKQIHNSVVCGAVKVIALLKLSTSKDLKYTQKKNISPTFGNLVNSWGFATIFVLYQENLQHPSKPYPRHPPFTPKWKELRLKKCWQRGSGICFRGMLEKLCDSFKARSLTYPHFLEVRNIIFKKIA